MGIPGQRDSEAPPGDCAKKTGSLMDRAPAVLGFDGQHDA